MKKLFAMVVLSASLVVNGAIAQEHKHEEAKDAGKAPAAKSDNAVKAEGKKCCEGMEKKAGDTKDAPPTKQEKMKAMKEKMAEKMKGVKDGEAASEPSKDAHQH